MDDDETYVCCECGEVTYEDEGDGDCCDECIALAEDTETLMHQTISDETRDRYAS